MPDLIITPGYNLDNSPITRNSCKVWLSSLLRHSWSGKIIALRNTPEALFPVGRPSLTEVDFKDRIMSMPVVMEKAGSAAVAAVITALEFAETNQLEFEWLLYSDVRSVALRNLDHLFSSPADILISDDRGLLDEGFFAVKKKHVPALIARCKEVGVARALLSPGWRIRRFENGEVVRTSPGVPISELLHAAVIRLVQMDEPDHSRLAFGLHMMATYWNPDGLYMDLLEA
jgi:hypothetical protein